MNRLLRGLPPALRKRAPIVKIYRPLMADMIADGTLPSDFAYVVAKRRS